MTKITTHQDPKALFNFTLLCFPSCAIAFRVGSPSFFLSLSFPVHAVTSPPVLSSSPPFCPLNLWALKFLFVPSHRLSLHLLSMFFHLFG